MAALDPWNFSDNLANAAVAGLVARGIPAWSVRSQVEQPQERVEVTAGSFNQASNQMGFTRSGQPFQCHYAGTLSFTVITQASGVQAPNHGPWQASIRRMLSRPVQFFTATNLPCYEILRITESTGDTDTNLQTDAYQTPLSFTVELGILGQSLA